MPSLAKLPADSDECFVPTPVTLSLPTWTDACGTDNDHSSLPDNTPGVSYSWYGEGTGRDILASVARGFVVDDLPEGWTKVGETEDAVRYVWTHRFSEEPCAEPTLDGTFITPVCVSDAAYLTGLITLVDPDGQSTGDMATISMTDGTHTYTYPQKFPLGEIKVLWPGATVNDQGKGVTWPGYITNADGTYTATDDPAYFGWTRGGVTVHVEVNPSIDVEVNYPPANPACLTSPPATSAGLASTGGGDLSPLLPIGGGLAALLGVALIVTTAIRRRA